MLQCRTIFAAINKWKGLSGTHWDDERGANITTNADAKVWDEFVANKVCSLPSQLRYRDDNQCDYRRIEIFYRTETEAGRPSTWLRFWILPVPKAMPSGVPIKHQHFRKHSLHNDPTMTWTTMTLL
jgi:hypothetical protein